MQKYDIRLINDQIIREHQEIMAKAEENRMKQEIRSKEDVETEYLRKLEEIVKVNKIKILDVGPVLARLCLDCQIEKIERKFSKKPQIEVF